MTVDPDIAIAPARIRANRWIILGVMLFAALAIQVDLTIVNIAIPVMEKSLRASFDEMLWVINGYSIVFATLLLTSGRLGDMYGPKRIFLTGLIIFTLGSLGCGLSQNATQLIICRAIQGVGGGLLTPQILALVEDIFPTSEQGTAFGALTAIAGISFAVGPVLGGFIVTNFDWHVIFFVNVPIGIVSSAACYLVMPDPREENTVSLDIPGVVTAGLALFLAVYALIQAQVYDWGPITTTGAFSLGPTRWSLISIYSLLVYSAVLLAVFFWIESREAHPVMRLSLFRDRLFASGNAVFFVLTFLTLGVSLLVSVLLQTVLGFSAIHTGLTLLPQAVALTAVAFFSGALAKRFGSPNILLLGMVAMAVGVLLLIPIMGLSVTSWALVVPMALLGAGYGLAIPITAAMAITNVHPDERGSASGMINTTWFMGALLGPTVTGAVLSLAVARELTGQASRFGGQLPVSFRGAFVSAWQAAAGQAQRFGTGQPEGDHVPRGTPSGIVHQVTALNHDVFGHAFVLGMRPAQLVLVVVGLLGVAAAVLMRSRRQSAPAAQHEAAVTASV